MSDAFIGEIRSFAGDYVPKDGFVWLPCDGRTLPLSEYQSLFTLIGTTFGGDGATNFALPNLNGRVPIQQGTGGGGQSYAIGNSGGSETVALTSAQMPIHTHRLYASSANGSSDTPSSALTFGAVPANDALYVDTTKSILPAPVAFSPSSVSATGQGTAHANIMPSIVITYMIATKGIFPIPA